MDESLKTKYDKSLETNEEFYKKIFDNLLEGVLLLNSNGTILYANSSMVKMIGLESSEDIENKDISNLIYKSNDEFIDKTSFLDAIKDRVYLGVHKISTKTGVVWVEISGSKFLYKNNNIIALFLNNITKNVNLKQKINKQNKELERLKKQKEDFIVHLGHDLKTPITPLLSLLPMIERREKDPKQKKLLQDSIKSIQRLKKQIDKILDLAKESSFGTEYNISKINLHNLVDSTLKDNEDLLRQSCKPIYNEIDEDIAVKADENKITRVINNFIKNYVKYSEEEGDLTFYAMDDGKMVTISVEDAGTGLTKTKVDRIFDEFYKGDKSRHDLESSGLGLPLCKKIIEKHGGEIWAYSAGKEKGLKFYFTLKSAKD
ncbi:MAG: PAS domain-containing sensor histidine kinase [Candidatus Thermoplasmatota archaeon]